MIDWSGVVWLRFIIALDNYGNKTALSLESSGLLAVVEMEIYMYFLFKKNKMKIFF